MPTTLHKADFAEPKVDCAAAEPGIAGAEVDSTVLEVELTVT
jgi:hypothetical protein